MPRLIIKKESSGNGTKVCVTNLGEVANALNTPPDYIMKWFAVELGAQARYTKDVREGQRAIINGAPDTKALQTLLDRFIEKYILCTKCGLPETDMYLKHGSVKSRCRACGKRASVDNVHKVGSFIAKHLLQNESREKCTTGDVPNDKQPANKDEIMETPKEVAAKSRKSKSSETRRKHEKELGASIGVTAGGSAGEERNTSRTKAKSSKKQEANTTCGKGHDTSNRNVTTKSEHKQTDLIGDDFAHDDVEMDDVIRRLKEFVRKSGEEGDLSVADFYAELRLHQLAKGFDNRMRLLIVFEVLWGPSISTHSLKEKIDFLHHGIKGVSMSAGVVLWSLCAYLERNPHAAKVFPYVLQLTYDEDWCEEDDILTYFNENVGEDEPGFAAAKSAARPFLLWLATSDCESDVSEAVDDD